MSENIIPLHGAYIPGKPQDDLVEKLEELLERARSGELQFMAFAGVDTHDKIACGWVGECRSVTSAAAITWLQHRYMTWFTEANNV